MKRNARWHRLRRIFRRDPAGEVDEELRYHVERRVAENVARGMDPEDARRIALERLGDLERVRAECAGLLASDWRGRDRRRWLRVSWLDVKLGIRMLLKYPGLSLVSVLGMAVAIAIGAGYFGAIQALLDPTLPLDEGDRVVTITNHDRSGNFGTAGAPSALDVITWRDEASSLRDVGAYRMERRNLLAPDGTTALVEVVEMTASGFRLARVPALLGRTLSDDDEREGAAPTLVIGYDEWRRRFDGDPDILGRTVRLGAEPYAIVGVMPQGYRFPFNDQFWVPLRLEPSLARAAGRPLVAFGRLADGLSLGQARAELTTIGLRMAATLPETHEHLRPRVLPYTWSVLNQDDPTMVLALRAIQLAVSLLLVLVAANVAILVYARTVTRTGEIAVRSALGASRRRVVGQLFVEALVLSGVAAAIGLTIAGVALRIFDAYQVSVGRGGMPFWIRLGLSPALVAYTALLAIVGGGIVGVVPALEATGRRVQSGLQGLPSRGSSMQLGRTWTALIVAQVAIAVAALPAAINFAGKSARLGITDPAAAAEGLVRASLLLNRVVDARMPADTAAYERARHARWAERSAELVRRLEAEPGVAGVTFAGRFPGSGAWSRVEIEDAATTDTTPTSVWTGTDGVGIDLFEVFGVSVLAGRGFVPTDARDDATAVIINRTLAERIADGANVLGRRLRDIQREGDGTPPGPWLEIVGVVPDFTDRFTAPNTFDGAQPRLFRAVTIEQLPAATLVVRVRDGASPAFVERFRDIAAAVDPDLVLERMTTVTGAYRREQKAFVWLALGIIAVTSSVLLLSAAGIFAMMSFTVARRRREIGIRSALGADPRRILTGVFRRAGAQLGTGVLVGLLVAGAFVREITGRPVLLLTAVAVLMTGIGLLAALGPARRGLAVQPTEALREE